MIEKIDKGDYNLVRSDLGLPIRIVGTKDYYSEFTEFKDDQKQYEEQEDEE